MSITEKIEPSKGLAIAVKIAGAGFLLAIPGIAGVTEYHHRELTHRSLELHPWLKRFIQWEMSVYAPDTPLWPAVHEKHHSIPDSNLKPFLDVMRAMEWKQANPDQFPDITIPKSFPYLDLFVDRFAGKDVLLIGHHAENIMIGLLGGAYKHPSSYSADQMKALLYPERPMYQYPAKQKKHEGEYSQDEIEALLLRDPHSPVLDPNPNGVRGILMTNVPRYQLVSGLFRNRRDLLPSYLQGQEVANHKVTRYRGFVEGSSVAAGLALIARNKYEPRDFLKAILMGIAINTAKLGFHILGGNVTNSLGHAGVMSPARLWNAIFGKEYKPVLNPDGTVSTDSVNGGILGRVISFPTLDEVGGQRVHHEAPWQIAYTFKEGWEGWKEAPWGKFLSVLAYSKYVPFIRPGKGFDLKEGEARPDIANPGVLLIQKRRREQMLREQEAASHPS